MQHDAAFHPIADPAERANAPSTGSLPDGGFAALVPELDVTDIRESLAFWRDVLGFRVAYDRPAAGFAYLTYGRVQVMLCQRNARWEVAETVRPFGRGVNFQMAVERIAPILSALEAAGWPLFEPASEVKYRVGAHVVRELEFLVQDPDGYLLRFTESLGTTEEV